MASAFQRHVQSVHKEKKERRKQLEQKFWNNRKRWSDEQLLCYLAAECRRQGRRPKNKRDVVGYQTILDRFHRPWDEVVAMALEHAAASGAQDQRSKLAAPAKSAYQHDIGKGGALPNGGDPRR